MTQRIETGVLVPTITVTADGTSLEHFLDISRFSKVFLYTYVSACTGTNPTLDITIRDWEENIGVTYIDVAFVQFNSAGWKRVTAAPQTRKIYATWVIGGTETPTFEFIIHYYGVL